MAEGAAHTIILREWSLKRYKAPLATAKDITPGMFCELTAAGAIQPFTSEAAVPRPAIVAVEAPEVGRGIDDDYAVDGEEVNYAHLESGEWAYALLAAGEDVAQGDLLEGDGAGGLQAGASAFVKALEAVDNSAGYEYVRIKVEVL